MFSNLISYMISIIVSTESPCKTPNRKEGVCVFVRDCKKLSDMIINYRNLSPSDQEFVRKSRCSSTGVTIKVLIKWKNEIKKVRKKNKKKKEKKKEKK